MNVRFRVVGLGEALFDQFPEGDRLGGAPLNVAIHAHRLGAASGVQGVVVSRVGQDPLGEQLIRELNERGLDTQYIQTDPDRPTGTVAVNLDADGKPTYRIAESVAWDWLQFDPDLESLAAQASAVCFGTLGQRFAESRTTIRRFLSGATHAFKLLDVNLRADFDDARQLTASLEHADALKISDEELEPVSAMAGLRLEADCTADDQCLALMKKFELDMVAQTRGAEGVRIYSASSTGETPPIINGAPVALNRQPGADTVGAGDSVAATLILGRLLNWPTQKTADLANRVGAYVAGQPGATPELPEDLLS